MKTENRNMWRTAEVNKIRSFEEIQVKKVYSWKQYMREADGYA